jgi:protoporphyrinogen/coproporphyrinogen III oxidase
VTRIAVVGGGIAGLAAAWELSGSGVEVVVLEASDRFGGKVRTSPFAGHPVDEGADAFLVRVPWALDLVRELGLEDELVAPAQRRAYVWSRGALRPLPEQHVLGVPLDLADLAATGLLDEAELAATERAMAEPHRAPDEGDVSVADLVAGAVGQPVLDRLVAPLLGGINAGRVNAMSAAAVTPQLLDAARHPGGLLAGLAEARRAVDPAAPVFGGFEQGAGRLVDRLVERLRARGVELRLGAPVTTLDDVEADGVVVAVPAFTAAGLVGCRALAEVEYASVALVTLAVDPAALDLPLDASGFLVPQTEGLLITACSWASSKWAHLRGGRVVLRASAGSAGDERADALSDDELVHRLVTELGVTMGLAGRPEEVRVSRWPRSLPQYPVGHLDHMAAIQGSLPDRVVVAGAAYRGVGLPACIHDGRSAARRLLEQ